MASGTWQASSEVRHIAMAPMACAGVRRQATMVLVAGDNGVGGRQLWCR